MINLMKPARVEREIERLGAWIAEVSARYGVPAAFIKAILYQEMTNIDAGDPLADLAVRFGIAARRDSSTGYAQIFGYVGVNAANFAVDRGLATYESLGITCGHRLDPNDAADVRLVWNILKSNRQANIELAALNMLAAADEVLGDIDFASFSDDDLKRVASRYNSNTRGITAYGEKVFAHYLRYLSLEGPGER